MSGPSADLIWPVGSESERYGTAPPAGWTIPLGFNQAYSLGVHPGLDISLPGESDLGEPVYAVAGGIVAFAGDCRSSFGNVVLIEHRDVAGFTHLWSQYAHLQRITVQVGQRVQQGDVIGTVGNGAVPGRTGPRFSAHLHFELRRSFVSACHWPSGPTHVDTPAVRAEIARVYVQPYGLLGR